MYVIRFTVNDPHGSLSFVGPCHAIKMLVASCSSHPRTTAQLLDLTRRYDAAFVDAVRSGLAVFDEFNTPENPAAVHRLLAEPSSAGLPPFRVFDEVTRRASLTPAGTGLILINLNARRIIQVQNSYADVQRSDRGRVRLNGRPTRTLYRYRLPDEWRIVP